MNPYPKTTNGKQKMGMKKDKTVTLVDFKGYKVPQATPKFLKSLKRSRIKPVSKKQAVENRQLSELVICLREFCHNKSELSGESTGVFNQPLEPHHIYGRLGKHMLSPFEIILVTREQHTSIHKHNNREQKMKLANLIHDKRISQGFKEEDYK